MKLYVWEDVLTDYTHGVMFALADSVEDARTLLRNNEKFSCNCDYHASAFECSCSYCTDLANEPKVYDDKVSYLVFGGG
jgi:hypothetical protein